MLRGISWKCNIKAVNLLNQRVGVPEKSGWTNDLLFVVVTPWLKVRIRMLVQHLLASFIFS